VSSASTAPNYDPLPDPSDFLDDPSGSRESVDPRIQPRFRVVERKAAAPGRRRRRSNPLHRTLALAAIPALCLLVYVSFWTLAMRGGYYKNKVVTQIRALRVENDDLEAQKRSLQSPRRILTRAQHELEMRSADRPEFSRLPTPEHVAQSEGQRSPQD